MNDRLANLYNQAEAIDQLLLDVDPSTDFFWELTAQREGIEKTLAILHLDNRPSA